MSTCLKEQNRNGHWRPWEAPVHSHCRGNESDDLKNHRKDQKIQQKCDECERKFTRKDNLTRHKKTKHQAQRVQCKYCNKPLSRRDAAKRHQRTCLKNSNPKKNGVKGEVKPAPRSSVIVKNQLNDSTNTNRLDRH